MSTPMSVYMVGNKVCSIAFEDREEAKDFLARQSVTLGFTMWEIFVIRKAAEVLPPISPDKKLLLEFADRIMCEWTLQQYWDGEPCEKTTTPEKLVDNFLAWKKDQAKNN